MKIFNCVLALSFFIGSAQSARAVELPPYIPRVRYLPNPLFSEEGFRQGVILRFSAVIGWHYEGELMMGVDTSPMRIVDQECVTDEKVYADSLKNPERRQNALENVDESCLIDENPWQFSVVNESLYDQMAKLGSAKRVVVYYTKPIWAPIGAATNLHFQVLWAKTLNIVHDIWEVDPNFPLPKVFSIDQGELNLAPQIISHADGYVEGRITKATLDHKLLKTYEVTIQLGQGGTNFMRMSVSDTEMYDHIVMSMLSGKLMRIGYSRLFKTIQGWWSDIRGYRTIYRVTSLEVLSDEQQKRQ